MWHLSVANASGWLSAYASWRNASKNVMILVFYTWHMEVFFLSPLLLLFYYTVDFCI